MKCTTLMGVCLVIAFTIACKKKKNSEPEKPADDPAPAPVIYPTYSRLKPGNYWIYKRYQIEQDGSAIDFPGQDSCYVSKDTIIRGQTYYKFHSYNFMLDRKEVTFLRDSLHYTVSADGSVVFSSEDYTTVFQTFYSIEDYEPGKIDTVYKMTRKMADKNLDIIVPAGTFATCNMQSTITMLKYITPGVNNPRYMNKRYSKDIGLISETELFFASSNFTTERRLVRYHVN